MRKIEIKSTRKKGQGNPAEAPNRRERELQDTHTRAHTHKHTHFQEKVQREQNCILWKRGREGEKKKKKD